MEQFTEFFNGLFSTSDWPPRWVCGKWTEFHGWLYICSDVAIWLAYFIIPVILIYFVQKRPNIPFLPVFQLFGAFIILCGATHILDAVIFWWPAYRLSALLRFFTAIVSVFTAIALARDLPKLLIQSIDVRSNTNQLQLTRLESDLAQSQNALNALRREYNSLKSKSIAEE